MLQMLRATFQNIKQRYRRTINKRIDKGVEEEDNKDDNDDKLDKDDDSESDKEMNRLIILSAIQNTVIEKYIRILIICNNKCFFVNLYILDEIYKNCL